MWTVLWERGGRQYGQSLHLREDEREKAELILDQIKCEMAKHEAAKAEARLRERLGLAGDNKGHGMRSEITRLE